MNLIFILIGWGALPQYPSAWGGILWRFSIAAPYASACSYQSPGVRHLGTYPQNLCGWGRLCWTSCGSGLVWVWGVPVEIRYVLG